MEPLPVSFATLEAMRILASAGVSDKVLGSVVREILNVQRDNETAAAPGHNADNLIERPTEQMPSAMTAGVQDIVMQGSVAPAMPSTRELIPIKLRLPNGQPTNITVPASLLAAAVTKMGSDREARTWIRSIACKMPEDKSNRSRWVQEQMTQALTER